MNLYHKHRFTTFVLMPFGNDSEYSGGNDESDFVFYEIITPGVNAAIERHGGMSCIDREVDKNQGGSITTSIIKSVVEADIVIVDITGRNPNVFLELGMRYALRDKITVIIAQEGTLIPFDISGYRCIVYNRFKPQKARKKIAEFIEQELENNFFTDSVVYDAYPTLNVTIPSVISSRGIASRSLTAAMDWQEYTDRIEWLVNLFRPAMKEGKFVPDAVLGISNGGMIAADLISREAFPRIPVFGIWADRQVVAAKNDPMYYFSNSYNIALLKALHATAVKTHPKTPFTVVILDDQYGHGTTSQQAIHLVESVCENKKTKSEVRIVYSPLVTRIPQLLDKVDGYLPYSLVDKDGEAAFAVTRQQYLDWLATDAETFPYQNKQIHMQRSNDVSDQVDIS